MFLDNKKWLFLIVAVMEGWHSIVRADDILYLELVVNGKAADKVFEVVQRENDWDIAYADVTGLGILLESVPVKERVLLSEIKGATATYDAQLQRLFIMVPSDLLPMQYLGSSVREQGVNQSRRDKGAFFNYSLVTISQSDQAQQSSLWHELTLFNSDAYLSSNGIFLKGDSTTDDSGYTRFDTFYQWDNEEGLWGVTLGDVINATPTWGRSIRMGGLRLARDYELDPTLITYPVPEFYGESALPGGVELLINDQLRWRHDVSAGPFMIDTVPSIAGAGVADILTTDAQGQLAQRRINFYVASELLSPGLLDYDFTLGFRRERFGLRSSDYAATPAVSGALRYGVNRYLTPELLVQGGEGLSLGGAGASFLVGSFGVFEVAHTLSHYYEERGNQTSIGYTYNQKKFDINARYLHRQGDYRDLGNVDSLDALHNSLLQLSFSTFSRKLGSLSIGYFQISDDEMAKRDLLNISWSRYFDSDITAFIAVNRQLHGRKDNILSFSLSIPLGDGGQGSLSALREADGNVRGQVQAMRNAPYSGGFGWGAGFSDSKSDDGYGRLDWRGSRVDLSASVYRSGGETQYIAEAMGALIYMDNDIYSTRTVTDAFAVVDTVEADIPVMIGHQLVGNTNKHGKLLIPDMYSYLENRLSIDPIDLPANASIENIEQMVIPRRKGGVTVKFPLVFSQAAIVQVVMPDNQMLPVGAVLTTENGTRNYSVGWDGELYIETLVEPVTLYWVDGECSVAVMPAPDLTIPLPRVGPFVCQPLPDSE